MESIIGIVPAMVTPIDEKGNIIEKSLRKLTNHLIEGGVHGLFPVSSTGEYYGLDRKQKREVLKIVVDETDSRVPVCAGTGAITTRETIELTKEAAEIGVEAVSIVTPMYIKPSQGELYNHYRNIANSVDIPILIYNNPSRTGVEIKAEVIERLSKLNNIVGIKDSSGDMTLTGEFIRRTDSEFSVLVGRDTLILSTMAYGGQGSITSTANLVPELPVKIYEEFKKGNLEKARELQFKLNPLRLAFNLGTFPVIVKEGLKLLGIEVGKPLEPVSPLEENKKKQLKHILENIGVM